MTRPQAMRAMRNIVDVCSSLLFRRESDFFTWKDPLLYYVLLWQQVDKTALQFRARALPQVDFLACRLKKARSGATQTTSCDLA